ncbi:MAG TPA: indole-3-glycerol phosphate synthase TrpC [Bryobacteraceae bacterium]|nr:indole-3-glycerol phosphate synthase TrpC [Bryobacteraceae bacterium]
MCDTAPGILSRIVRHKRAELARASATRDEWERKAAENPSTRRDFAAALGGRAPAIIAEIKKASPSKGLLAAEFNPPALARDYERGGAAALSVLTDQEFFQGGLSDLLAAREATGLPVLRKDFIIDELQVAEAAAHSADAILLIAAILPLKTLRQLREYAAGFGMAALVEVHDDRELELALLSGAQIVGVNNRNLHTFEVTLETSLRLAEQMPQGVLKVSESGIASAGDIRRLRAAGFDAFLVGEHLVRSADRSEALRALMA